MIFNFHLFFTVEKSEIWILLKCLVPTAESFFTNHVSAIKWESFCHSQWTMSLPASFAPQPGLKFIAEIHLLSIKCVSLLSQIYKGKQWRMEIHGFYSAKIAKLFHSLNLTGKALQLRRENKQQHGIRRFLRPFRPTQTYSRVRTSTANSCSASSKPISKQLSQTTINSLHRMKVSFARVALNNHDNIHINKKYKLGLHCNVRVSSYRFRHQKTNWKFDRELLFL